ncbi:precorrin-2 dehydrogenase/sirohydrochlorin ferrochelatase family protein [Emticicia fluvialis]|uniref:precorrin-2 dehydrogenase/sirohydrochlorin ferrochelatase family protein n=1 Tax=Emticicia fluvialis TaxID=2974474 RepID=UPI0021653227|nr:bifunctional precorrin-2 dehydrogenase/sirohydrochlorin ferrochelatase [Emticicia fluvialis]
MNTLFPIFLKLEHLHTLIVGGGNVGLEKLEAVLKNSPKAKITLVAPEIKEEIRHLAQSHDLTLVFEKYDSQYLHGIDLVIAGTDDKSVNQQVQIDCKARKIMVNIADTPDLCDFYLSSVVQKDDLKIAISTNGKSPTFAKRFREILEEILPDNLQETLDNLQAIRNKLKGDFQDKVQKLNEITKVMRNQ